MRVSIGQLTDWIVENRRGRAFREYTREEIQEEITEGWYFGVLVYHVENDKIWGVALGKRDDQEKIVWIHDVLTTRPDIIKKFMERFMLVYPSYELRGQRNQRLRVFNKPLEIYNRL